MSEEPMRAYVGQARGAAMIGELVAAGLGEATQRGEFPPRRMPFFLDNGAFTDWRNGREFSERAFLADVERIAAEGPTPDFIVAPDRVADRTSLAWSLEWAPRLRGAAPLALVVQDGMEAGEVSDALTRGGFSVLFVGGSLEWKLQTAGRWVRLAHVHGKRCHIGRMGTARRVRFAREIGADSVDSCTPLWSRDHLRRFLEGLRAPFQPGLYGAHPPPAVKAWGNR